MTALSNHWPLRALSDVCDLITDGSHFSPKTVDAGYPYITVRDLNENGIDFANCKFISQESFDELQRNGCRPIKGDILFSKDGTVGKVAQVLDDTQFVVLSSLAILRPNKDLITSEFLKLALRSPMTLESALGMKTGTALRRVVLRNLKTLEIPLPPLPEQHRIVETLEDHLSRLDAALADVKQAKLKAAQFRRSLLQAAFTGNLGLDESSFLAEPPPHWSSMAVGELCGTVEKIDPANLGRDDFWYVDIGALEPSSSSLENVTKISTTNAPGRARQLIRSGDSIFATVRPYMKKVAYIANEFDGQIASTGFCVLRPIQEKLHSKYLFYFLLSDQLLDQVLPLQRGVSYPAIRDKDLKNAYIPVPPIDEQNKIVELLEDHLSRLEASISLADAMERQSNGLRRSLLQAAFTGQLTKEVVSV